ncbi:hypothetical protein NFI96_009588, partial [Prochilodus magdalenae]
MEEWAKTPAAVCADRVKNYRKRLTSVIATKAFVPPNKLSLISSHPHITPSGDHTMAHALYPNPSTLHPVESSAFQFSATRLSIFLICDVCVGVPLLAWATGVLHRHHTSKGRIPGFVFPILLNDLLELTLNLYMIGKLLQGEWCLETDTACYILSSLWSASLLCGVHLQQMMLLESALILSHPSCSTHAFFSPCSIVSSIIVYAGVFLWESFSVALFLFSVLLALLAAMVTSWLIICRTPPIKTHRSHGTEAHEYVLAFATLTLTVYLIFLLLYFFLGVWEWWMMSVSLLSVRVIVDPMLCVLVCREVITHGDLSTDQTSVQAEPT